MIFHWQETLWAALAQRAERLPHGLLFAGPAGIGKRAFATAFAQSLLCTARTPGFRACGRCDACRWFAAGTHPDFRLVQPEAAEAVDPQAEAPTSSRKPSKLIRIEQARALQDWLGVGAHQGGWRIAILHPSEAMNTATANALLKTLEEPPPRTVLILIAAEPARLLPTIRSRTQTIAFPMPARDVAVQWLAGQAIADAPAALALAGGAPLAAAESAERVALARTLAVDLAQSDQDAVALSARYQSAPIGDVIDLLQKWSYDLAATLAGLALRYYPSEARALERASRGLDARRVLAFQRKLAAARGLADHPLAPRLVLEELFIHYAQLRTNPIRSENRRHV